MTAFASFPWPRVTATSGLPRWTGQGFLIDGQPKRILAYGTETSHWSDDLTTLHETEAGTNHPIDLASRQLAVATMRKVSTPAPVIMDVGCSSGFVLQDLRATLPFAHLIGADYLPGPLEGLARRMPDVPILQFDLRNCPLPENCVDGITCLNVLEHIDDHVAALAEIHRILKPGGYAHIEVPAGPSLYDIYDEFLMHHRRYRLADLTAMARQQGFVVTKATHLGALVYPAFRMVKVRNRKYLPLPPDEKTALVAKQIRLTRRSPLLAGVMRFEVLLGRAISYPCGIRCIVVLRKT